jgi:hypothetical protein
MQVRHTSLTCALRGFWHLCMDHDASTWKAHQPDRGYAFCFVFAPQTGTALKTITKSWILAPCTPHSYRYVILFNDSSVYQPMSAVKWLQSRGRCVELATEQGTEVLLKRLHGSSIREEPDAKGVFGHGELVIDIPTWRKCWTTSRNTSADAR